MENKKHRWILYFIIITILTTVSVQLYWNYKNYEQNKQRVLNEIQLSLDNSIEAYYVNLSKKNHFAIVEPEKLTLSDELKKDEIWKNIFKKSGIKKNKKLEQKKDSLSFKITSIEINTDETDFKKMDSSFIESIFKDETSKQQNDSIIISNNIYLKSKKRKKTIKFHKSEDEKVKLFLGKKATDSLKLIKGLQTIFIAIQNDTINYKNIDSILSKELISKGINTKYYFNHLKKDTLFYSNKTNTTKSFLKAESKSTYLKADEKFNLYYKNPTYEALKRSSTGIILSLLLSLAVISSLFYLLKVINQQKELAEIKNDLISNITHEFKTPITTISTAIEAIDNFNMIDDKEKTKKYLSISSVQLKKLHQMVEKLLETATLDSENLMLQKEPINIIDLVEKISQKQQQILIDKNIYFSTNIATLTTEIDVFHLENAVSNLIDNAIKYGGDTIQINIVFVPSNIEISITDNGIGIEKNQQEKIFEKFYRVPKGNTHDVKGFGIGLYYSKKIIEKHNGFLSLTSNSKETTFKITLPNE
ncbi:HAMP domain-containing histidine kinase [Tenacibaculum sp. AHE15PA]|uniref:sensor histidine kinase n=1 Tax=unclassified Tenacibaculum TaxID=2635139 RepID=UPI001C4F9518|nr:MULTISPECIES: HAMP domain-containing sensor histidine kinase [unclassified Tenacibaculum]QXP72711.1 HAMP domain-containing histidine kinase [Tenacibaculum sp. AHE14PA]QXP76626.1 HAMP domain-containing histidine kinase [Tenacibaculum sp. AHE15PA]